MGLQSLKATLEAKIAELQAELAKVNGKLGESGADEN